MSKINLFGYQISNDGLSKNVELAWELIKSKKTGSYLACINPHSVVVASKDILFNKALINADILIPDGFGIILASKILNLSPSERVTGFDFFINLTKNVERKGGLKYFFLGSTEKVLYLIKKRIEREFPHILVCGFYSPPFRNDFSDEENNEIIRTINSCNPDVLWVGMTAPKQEKWIYKNRLKLNVPFIAAIGAAFDYYAGTKKRASIFWQKIGLEWLPRFIREPRRLWERNLKSTPIFLYWVFKIKASQIFSSILK